MKYYYKNQTRQTTIIINGKVVYKTTNTFKGRAVYEKLAKTNKTIVMIVDTIQ